MKIMFFIEGRCHYKQPFHRTRARDKEQTTASENSMVFVIPHFLFIGVNAF